MLELESAEIISKLLLRPWAADTGATTLSSWRAPSWLVSTGVRGLDCGHRTELLLVVVVVVVMVMVLVLVLVMVIVIVIVIVIVMVMDGDGDGVGDDGDGDDDDGGDDGDGGGAGRTFTDHPLHQWL